MTFAVNYVGHPFNKGIMKNRGMSAALRYGGALFVVLTLDLVPGLGGLLSLVPVPYPLNVQMVSYSGLAFGATLWWEYLLRTVFPAPRPPEKAHLRYLTKGKKAAA